MTSFVNLALGLVLAVMSPAAAPAPGAVPQTVIVGRSGGVATPGPTTTAIDPAWVERVSAGIAQRGNVPASAVRLAWGALPSAGMPAANAPFRILGGANGWFVLSIDTGGDVEALRVRAGGEDSVCVAARDMARGEQLHEGDFALTTRVRWGAPRSNRGEPRPSAGWQLRRTVITGTVIDRPTALPPELVSAGDRIELWWNRGDVALALSGVALHGARLGEAVRVRIDGRPRPLLAIVDAPGRARIGTREAS